MSGNAPERPHGQRFSHVYMRSDELLQESSRARRRVAALLESTHWLDGISATIISELGVDPIYGYQSVNWARTLEHFSTRDFLDIFTVVCRHLGIKRQSSDKFVTQANRIFAEENLAYEIDSGGGVHFRVDAEFAANTRAAIAALNVARYGNVRTEFDRGMSALSGVTPNGKEAIRGVFGAAESLYRLMFSKAPKLTAADATKNLQVLVQSIYASDAVAQRAASKIVNSFADWVDACHHYRHEQGVEEPSQPPLDLAIELVSAGAGYVRWLATCDKHSKS